MDCHGNWSPGAPPRRGWPLAASCKSSGYAGLIRYLGAGDFSRPFKPLGGGLKCHVWSSSGDASGRRSGYGRTRSSDCDRAARRWLPVVILSWYVPGFPRPRFPSISLRPRFPAQITMRAGTNCRSEVFEPAAPFLPFASFLPPFPLLTTKVFGSTITNGALRLILRNRMLPTRSQNTDNLGRVHLNKVQVHRVKGIVEGTSQLRL